MILAPIELWVMTLVSPSEARKNRIINYLVCTFEKSEDRTLHKNTGELHMLRKLKNNKVFTMRLPKDQWEALVKESDDHERSVAAHFRIIIRDYLKKKSNKKGGE